MTSENNLRGIGWVCLNSAFVLQLSWIPALGVLDGEPWASAALAGLSHRFGLAFLLAAPLAYGVRVWLSAREQEDGEMIRTWAARCLAPLAAYAVLIKLAVNILPHVTAGAIIGLMAANLSLGCYGMALRWEAAKN